MALMDFIKKQFIDIIQWTESGDGTLAWRFPMAEMEIQNGASLTVRESQMAVFVNEGKVADVFGPGMYKLTTQTLPVLTYLKNWDKLFESPFKSDVYFFSTRQQVDQKWGTPQPITIRDKDFGAVRLRAFGNYSFRIGDAKLFHTEISGTRDIYTVADLDGQLRGLMLQNISNAIACSGVPFLDLAANQIQFAQGAGDASWCRRSRRSASSSRASRCRTSRCPKSCRRSSTRRSAWAWSATTWASSCSTRRRRPSRSSPKARAAAAASRATRWAWARAWRSARCWRRTSSQGLQPAQRRGRGGRRSPRWPWSSPADVMATLEKLGELKTKGILTQEEFDAKKAELLKKLV